MIPIPERFRAACTFCNREVDIREVGTHQYTKGWVRNRAGGGGHGISLPERENRWAHEHCVKSAKAPPQPSLFDELAEPAKSAVPAEPQPTNAGYEGHMIVHVCNVCGGTAPYGVGVALRKGDLGLWYCGQHLPTAEVPF